MGFGVRRKWRTHVANGTFLAEGRKSLEYFWSDPLTRDGEGKVDIEETNRVLHGSILQRGIGFCHDCGNEKSMEDPMSSKGRRRLFLNSS